MLMFKQCSWCWWSSSTARFQAGDDVELASKSSITKALQSKPAYFFDATHPKAKKNSNL